MSPSPRVLCLSSVFSTDRVLLHSTFLEHLEEVAVPAVWSRAVLEATFTHEHPFRKYFRLIPAGEEFPHWLSRLRHFVDYVADFNGKSVSRESHWRHKKSKTSPWVERRLRGSARWLATLGLEAALDNLVQAAVLRCGASTFATEQFFRAMPSVVIAMCPFKPAQMSIVAAAKKLGIPVVAYITSWDNITTKTRLALEYDAYIVWSEQMKKELQEFYGWAGRVPIFTVGAPQYDVFFRGEFQQSREEFFRQYDFDADRPLILYCLGSPNIIREDYGALQFVERASATPELSAAQIVVRPHPGFYEHGYSELDELRRRFPQVAVQTPHRHWNRVPFQSTESVIEWVNSVRHADVVVNLASTMTVDAAVVDRPVVNLDFDPEPGSPNQLYVKEINHCWNHFSPVAESGGVWLVNNLDELTTAVAGYLKAPELHREQRKWIVKHVCGQADGNSGRRMAEVVARVARGHGTSVFC